jgi:transposase
MAAKKGQKKRVWSDDEKRLICAQARFCGVSVTQVAPRYAMNTNLIHKWLRDPRFALADQAADVSLPEGATFLPVEFAGIEPIPAAPVLPTSSTGSFTAQRVDITLSDGRRILMEGTTALPTSVALVEGFAQ